MDMPTEQTRRSALGFGGATLLTTLFGGIGNATAKTPETNACAASMAPDLHSINAIRVYTGDDGHSHFEDIVLKGEEVSNFRLQGDKTFTSGFRTFMRRKATTITLLSGPANLDLPEHNAPTDKKEFFFMIQGSNKLITRTDSRWITPGIIVFFEDATGTGHSGKVGPEGYTVINVQLAD